MATEPVLINNEWRQAQSSKSFQAINPQTRESLSPEYPVSDWADCDAALDAASVAAAALAKLPSKQIADFLNACADEIEANAEAITKLAADETALPVTPRLADIELPRTTNQLRQAAKAAEDQSWSSATIDTATGIRSLLAPIGPVAVFGPNNFPLAFNGIAGGDFAAAIAAGNPVIAKANPGHPGTTRLLAEAIQKAAVDTNMPSGTVQMVYRMGHAEGERLVSDPRLGAVAYTGAQGAGLKLKAAADAVGKPIYLELSAVNPVVFLPGAIEERGSEIAGEFVGSCLVGTGQFCTNPGLIVLIAGDATDKFLGEVTAKFGEAPVGTLLSPNVESSLKESLQTLASAGAAKLTDDAPADKTRCCVSNTLLKITGDQFLADPIVFQTEAFGNASLAIVAKDISQAQQCLEQLEGSLTACVYSHTEGADDTAYDQLAPALRKRAGRLLNDKMPTGVAVSPAMNHGGPFPATGHPNFTAVGIPTSLRRFAMLQCYDNVRPHRLPAILQDKNPTGKTWRYIDGNWSQADA